MGVTHLWQILQPIAKPIKIHDLKDKTIAVDLSIWICENTTFKHNSQNLKPHLRNLFFRCKSLLEIGCTLVFVREGDVIELKRDTMQKRNNVRFGGGGGKKQATAASYETDLCELTDSLSLAASKSKPKKRSNFDFYINECCELLNYIGVAVIRSPCGEAEKSCAYLDLIGKCDGVISDDSDVFLYGAKTVYRNFNIDKKSEISIEEYTMSDIEAQLGYDREMLVAFALFLGCDYDQKGVPGCGVQMANKFFNEVKEFERKERRKVNVLDLLRKWQSSDYESNGMPTEEKLRRIVNTHIDNSFPNEKIIREYLFMEDSHKKFLASEFDCNHKWRRPNLYLSQRFNDTKQTWEYTYTAEKIIPLIILYENATNVRSVKPIGVSKSRKQAGVDYYEVRWSRLAENNSYNDRDLSDLNEYATLEKPDVFESYFPNLVNEFKETVINKKSAKKTSKRKGNEKATAEKVVESEVIKNTEEDKDELRYSENEVEEQVCSQFEIKKVVRDDTIILLDDDSDTSDTDSEPIIITHVRRMEGYNHNFKQLDKMKVLQSMEIHTEVFDKRETENHELNRSSSVPLTVSPGIETNDDEIITSECREDDLENRDAVILNPLSVSSDHEEPPDKISIKPDNEINEKSSPTTSHDPKTEDNIAERELNVQKILGKPPLPPIGKKKTAHTDSKPAFEQENASQSSLVAGFVENYLYGRSRQVNSVDKVRDTLRDSKKNTLIDSESDKEDDALILSSSDDEHYQNDKNTDVKSLLEKFNLIKLESTVKKPKKSVPRDEERKPLKAKQHNIKSLNEPLQHVEADIYEINQLIPEAEEHHNKPVETDNNEIKKTKVPKIKQDLADKNISSPLPFHERMKKMYNNASIFKS